MRLIIKYEIITMLIEMARNSGIEVCGFLFGRREGDDFIVLEARQITNKLESQDAFEMEPLKMVRAIDEAEKRGLEIVGIFHSHINCPPVPSGRDLKGMRNWRVPWLIVTPKGEARAWILGDGGIEEVELSIT
ncbi:M67 family metallopeptidase [Thermococcus sp.]|uniref:M67 family metallopeptidase n=1 Tax=Thermococcus sp. TaxID=35749 RepID=UPI002606C794|nr:M67 family metallopeptidase [Thermococcus sp.]